MISNIAVSNSLNFCLLRIVDILISAAHCCINRWNSYTHLMRLWYFLSSVNSFFKHPMGLDVWCLVEAFIYFMHVNSERSGETAQMRRLTWVCRLAWVCDKYHNLMSWLIFWFPHLTAVLIDETAILFTQRNVSEKTHWVVGLWFEGPPVHSSLLLLFSGTVFVGSSRSPIHSSNL